MVSAALSRVRHDIRVFWVYLQPMLSGTCCWVFFHLRELWKCYRDHKVASAPEVAGDCSPSSSLHSFVIDSIVWCKSALNSKALGWSPCFVRFQSLNGRLSVSVLTCALCFRLSSFSRSLKHSSLPRSWIAFHTPQCSTESDTFLKSTVAIHELLSPFW